MHAIAVALAKAPILSPLQAKQRCFRVRYDAATLALAHADLLYFFTLADLKTH